MKKLCILLLLATLALAGCQTMGERDTLVRAPITYGILKLIGDDLERAQKVHDIGQTVVAMIEDTTATVELIDATIRAQIDWTKLDPADTALALEVLAEIRHQLERNVEGGLLSPEHRVRVRQVVGYAVSAAKIAGAL